MMPSSSFTEPNIFEGLNARKLSSAEIAASFVMPKQFEQLISPDHALLIGPRGSGKTTLLRMLQGQSLTSWRDSLAETIVPKVSFSSIFVPADRLWASQLAFGPRDQIEAFAQATFTTQVLSAFLDTALYRLGEMSSAGELILHPAVMDPSAEAEFVDSCSQAWGLQIRGHSIFRLQAALDRRLQLLSEGVEAVDDSKLDSAADEISNSPLLLPSLRLAIQSFNRLARQVDHRWALLLDEMELAPRTIHESLMANLRGGERLLILKLSFSPFDSYMQTTPSVGGAAADHDYRAIHLSSGQRGTRSFTNEMLTRMMLQADHRPVSAQKALGPSRVDNSGQAWRVNNYDIGSEQQALFEKMMTEDETFSTYLAKRKIHSYADLESLSYAGRSSTLRKIYPLLVFRDAMLEFKDGTSRRRPRKKVAEYFSGADTVITALEGNPRWIKAAFSQMLIKYNPEDRFIPRGVQWDVLSESARRFESLLRLLPPVGSDASQPVLRLVDQIASYFNERALGQFTADPPSTFLVDHEVPESVVAALRAAVIAGAVVHVRSESSPPVLSELLGERFRIAHLLAIRDGLEMPLRVGKSVNLSTVLRSAEVDATRSGTDPALTLFDWWSSDH